jgi:dUTP pyrophosphatase
MSLTVKVKKLHQDAQLPRYSTDGAVGLDFYSYEEHTLQPGDTYTFKTGIAMEIPEGYGGFIWDRSGLSSKSAIEKMAGVIDPDYRGDVGVVLHNTKKESYTVSKGDKIAQMVIQKVEKVNIVEVKELSETQRGSGGFGSTGKK